MTATVKNVHVHFKCLKQHKNKVASSARVHTVLFKFKAPANEETLLRKHCCFPKCFPVCADRKHLLRKHFLLPRNKKCFWLFSETFCFFNKCFPVCGARKQCFRNSVSATMFPRLRGPLKSTLSQGRRVLRQNISLASLWLLVLKLPLDLKGWFPLVT